MNNQEPDTVESSPPRARRVLPILVIAGVLFGASGVGLVLMRQDPGVAEARTPDANLEGYQVPDFTLVNQRGEGVDASIFDANITVLDFIFTNCPFICPGMNQRMKMLHDDLKGTGVRFVSISVDPQHDTPERLRAYANTLAADPGRWSFLTGQQDASRAIVRTLGFDVSTDDRTMIDLEGGATMANISHPSRLILVGPDRQILGLYSWAHDSDMVALENRARILARHR